MKHTVTVWEYNAARILTALARVFENNGGVVAPTEKAEITNLTAINAIKYYNGKIARYTNAKDTANKARRQKLDEAIYDVQKKLEAVENRENGPIVVTNLLQIAVKIEGMYIMLQLDDVFLAPFRFIKTAICDNTINANANAKDLSKDDWLYDCFLEYSASDDDVKEAAHLIYNQLMSATPCDETLRVRRVPLTF